MAKLFSNQEAYPDLFHAIQISNLMLDSKLFADAIPKRDPDKIRHEFNALGKCKSLNLQSFIDENFNLPEESEQTTGVSSGVAIRSHIESMWARLEREPDNVADLSSLIPLPFHYLVPGGRFREIYYWDSYFTMLGYVEDRGPDMLINMLDNFAYLSDQVGHIPNGNRSYFCSRSQPPVFALMLELLLEYQETESVYGKYLGYLETEYKFWMWGAEDIKQDGDATRRVIRVGGGFLNRYWDDLTTPRPESYAEDLQLLSHCSRGSEALFRDIRAACESGWDFSTRWFDESQEFSSIQTTSVLPVDLNTLLFKLENLLAKGYACVGHAEAAAKMQAKAEIRREMIQTYFYNDKAGMFVDLEVSDLSQRPVLSLAGVFPLFAEIATKEQAERVKETVAKEFLYPGGWVTSLNESCQQWDSPNGWAPLQWVTFEGLRKYGYFEEAKKGAVNWVDNNLALYQQTGAIFEKYDVKKIGSLAGGGEYAVQHGFGWSNGILLKFMNFLESDAN